MSEKLKLKRELSEACQPQDMLRQQLDEANAVIATYRKLVTAAYTAVNEHLEEE